MYKTDIKDFYMSECHGGISECSTELISPPRVAAVCRRMLKLLLTNQFVSWPTSEGGPPSDVFRVAVGSGMGQLCSDECSSSSFYIKCEKTYALDAGCAGGSESSSI